MNCSSVTVGVRLKLAFCMTCATCVLVLAQGPSVMTVRLGLLFSFYLPSPTTVLWMHPPSLLVIALSWTYPPIPRLGHGALWTAHLSPPYIYYMPYPRPHCTTYMCISTCWCAPFVPLLCLPLLIATLCITAPFVHASRPPYMCNTMPLVRILVV